MQLFPFFLKLKKYFFEIKTLKARKKLLGKPSRSQYKFNKKYPYASIGRHSYGTPSIKHRHPNTTLTIGNYCSIASNVEIFLGGNHRTDWVTNYPFPQYIEQAAHIQNCTTTHGNVNIGSDVWLCQNVTILSGITIGHGAVVASGAIVTKDVPPYAIVGGNPAKLIRYRFDEPTINTLLNLAWWDWPEEEILNAVDLLCSKNIEEFINYAKNRS